MELICRGNWADGIVGCRQIGDREMKGTVIPGVLAKLGYAVTNQTGEMSRLKVLSRIIS